MTYFKQTHCFLPFAFAQPTFLVLLALWNRMTVCNLDAHLPYL